MNRRPSHTKRAILYSVILAGCALFWFEIIGALTRHLGFYRALGTVALVSVGVLALVGLCIDLKRNRHE